MAHMDTWASKDSWGVLVRRSLSVGASILETERMGCRD